MHVTIRGKVWRLTASCSRIPAGLDGYCDNPTTRRKRILIRSGLKGRYLLDVLLHEIAHASLWDLGEKPIDSLATSLAHFLWEQGVRPRQRGSKRAEEKLRQAINGFIWTRGELAAICEIVRGDVATSLARVLQRLRWAHVPEKATGPVDPLKSHAKSRKR